MVRSVDNGYCVITDLKGQFTTFVPNVLLKSLHVSVVPTYKVDSVSKE